MRLLQNFPQFLADVEGIVLAIAADNQAAALRFIDSVESAARQIGRFPFIGTKCRFVSPRTQGMRVTTVTGFRRYLIYFRVTDDAVEFVRLVHGARDQDAVFEEEEPGE